MIRKQTPKQKIIQELHDFIGTIVHHKLQIYCTLDSSLYLDCEEVTYGGFSCIELHYIKVASWAREKGLGTETLKKIISFCNERSYGILLYPCPVDDQPMSQKKLSKWYSKHGFIKVKGSHVMEWLPVYSQAGLLNANIKFFQNK